MKIETREFEFAHGKSPRGEGNWAFVFELENGQSVTEFAPGTMKYSEAKKWALARAGELNAMSVEVGS